MNYHIVRQSSDDKMEWPRKCACSNCKQSGKPCSENQLIDLIEEIGLNGKKNDIKRGLVVYNRQHLQNKLSAQEIESFVEEMLDKEKEKLDKEKENNSNKSNVQTNSKNKDIGDLDLFSRTLTSARLKSLPNNVTLEVLINKANKAFQLKHFSNAVRIYTFSIDKFLMEKTIFKMTDNEKIRLAKLYGKRAECNFEMGKSQRSEKNIGKVIDDCSFVLETGIFKRDLIEAEFELSNNLKQLLKKATQLKEDLSNRETNKRSNNGRRRRRPHRDRGDVAQVNEDPSEQVEIKELVYKVDANLCSELGKAFLNIAD